MANLEGYWVCNSYHSTNPEEICPEGDGVDRGTDPLTAVIYVAPNGTFSGTTAPPPAGNNRNLHSVFQGPWAQLPTKPTQPDECWSSLKKCYPDAWNATNAEYYTTDAVYLVEVEDAEFMLRLCLAHSCIIVTQESADMNKFYGFGIEQRKTIIKGEPGEPINFRYVWFTGIRQDLYATP
jgi:hypothetical protein